MKKKVTTLRLIDFDSHLTTEFNDENSDVLFDHLWPNPDGNAIYVDMHLETIKSLAKAHGWKVKFRVPSEKELNKHRDDGGG